MRDSLAQNGQNMANVMWLIILLFWLTPGWFTLDVPHSLLLKLCSFARIIGHHLAITLTNSLIIAHALRSQIH